MLVAAPDFATLTQAYTLMNQLVSELGVSFKHEKDIGFDQPCHTLEFLGIQLSTAEEPVTAAPPPDKLRSYSAQLQEVHQTGQLTFLELE